MINNQGKGFRRLRVWKEAHGLVLLVYQATRKFPKDELFGLTSQLRRAVVSIAANIVEGQARASRKEFLQFLSIANGSLVEVEYYLELAKDLDIIGEKEFLILSSKRREVGILLHAFIQSLRRS